MGKTSDKYWSLCIYLTLALTTIAAYWQLRHNEFIKFDDHLYIVDNPHVKDGLTWQGLVWAFTSTHAYNWHPLTWISHMLDAEFHGLAPGGHHFNNVIFHAANAILLFLVIRRLTGALWPSAFVAAVFALHPLHVESVAWASERKDVLSTFFWFLTTWAYARYVARPVLVRYLLIMLFFALGLLAKQMLVTLPVVLLLLDYWPLRRLKLKADNLSNSRSVSVKRCILEKLPLLVLSAVASVVVFLVQEGTVVMKSLIEHPLSSRLANALVAYMTYIGKMLWPAHLAIFYPHFGGKLLTWQIAAAALLLIAITALVIWKSRQYPYLPVGWFWYLGTLVPVIGLIQVGNQGLADRYTYIPLTGLFIVVAWGIPDLLGRLRYHKLIFSFAAAALLAILGLLTRAQVAHWRNDATVLKHATQAVRNNWWAQHAFARLLHAEGNLDQAIDYYIKSLQSESRNSFALNNLGLALVQKREFDKAIVCFTKALQLRPDRFEVHMHLGAALAENGQPDKAIAQLKQALQINPDAYRVHHNLGVLFTQQGEFQQAISHFKEVLRIDPDHVDANINLGLLFVGQREFEEAINHYTEALRIRPNSSDLRAELAETHNSLGIEFGRQRKLPEAIAHFTRAIEVKPDFAGAYNNLGYALFLQGRHEQALAHYLSALRIDPNYVDARYNLAVVLTEQDKTDEAIKQYRKVLEINPNHTKARNVLTALLEKKHTE
jgi:tetratricopeptide (TPR) repeat protein